MTESADCRCESILSPQMGPDQDPPARRDPVTDDRLVDTGSFFVPAPKDPMEES